MLKIGNWKNLAEFVGVMAIVASLLFVGLQMRQAQNIAMSDGALANAANNIEKNTAIRENSEVWIKGNSGKELTENEALVFQTLVRSALVADFMEITRLRRVGAEDIAVSLTADFSAFLFEHPGARRIWIEDRQSTDKYRSLLVAGTRISDDVFAETVILQLEQLDRMNE